MPGTVQSEVQLRSHASAKLAESHADLSRRPLRPRSLLLLCRFETSPPDSAQPAARARGLKTPLAVIVPRFKQMAAWSLARPLARSLPRSHAISALT